MIKILFICHGNICRSPMAEFVMKYLVQKAGCGDRFYIESAAATCEEIGNDLYPPAKRKLTEKGIPFTHRGARIMTRADYARFDYIIGMDEENLYDMRRICGGDPERKISLLPDWAGRKGRGIFDPWYSGDFETAYREISEGCTALLKALRQTCGDVCPARQGIGSR